NEKGNQNAWLQIDLVGTSSNRFAIGASVTIKAGPLLVFREVKGSEGFGSTDPYRLHFGLGQQQKIDSIQVSWPSGKKQVFRDLEPNQRIEINESSDVWQNAK
ncbi:MAG TPA: ASPIC/UnbV domain-containing protein, partial [Acidobacteriota bacterium]|nr:ASPIC/UnbV domain-containing protein [Acidobacteriota bacterium]